MEKILLLILMHLVLLTKLVLVFFNSDIFKSFLSKYGVLCFYNILQIWKIVHRAFEQHCESVVTS